MTEEIDWIRERFDNQLTDGIEECIAIIERDGGSITRFVISVTEDSWRASANLRGAVDFLVDEWDYELAEFQ